MALTGTLELSTGRRIVVEELLGIGAQGAVYAVDSGGQRLALKWYHPRTATASQRRALELLARRGAPDRRFIWPLEVVDSPDLQGWGYLMPLRPEGQVHLGQLLRGEVPSSYTLITTLGRELADTFLSLHAQGLCYRDINFTNVSFDPATGVPCIMDTDNVGVDGESSSEVLGSRRFMAPEIVRREALPSTLTDLWSMAVLLFYILMFGHPLLGRRELDFACMNSQAESVLFGKSPVFVLDPADPSNAPVPGRHDNVIENWRLYPEYIRRLFTQTFTVGIAEPQERVVESQWRSALARLGDSLGECHACGAQLVVDPEDPSRPCWSCHTVQLAPLRLSFSNHEVVLTSDRRLFPHHLRRDYDYGSPFAAVARHPVRQQRWGLANLGTSPWTATLPDGTRQQVPPGATIALVRGARFDFGPAEAELIAD